MGNLLKPGGVIGVREVDWGSMAFYPESGGMRRFLRMYYDLAHRNGGEPNAGRHMRLWFREAGFSNVQVSTSTTSYAEAEATRDWANTYAERTLHSSLAEKALEYGIATRADLESMATAWRTWGEDRDAVFCFCHAEAIAHRAP